MAVAEDVDAAGDLEDLADLLLDDQDGYRSREEAFLPLAGMLTSRKRKASAQLAFGGLQVGAAHGRRRSFFPDSSANTNPTSTTSPRLQTVIGGVARIVPECRQHRVGLGGQRQQLRLITQVVTQALFDRVQHVLPYGDVTLGRREPKPSAYFWNDIDANPGALCRRLH